MYKEISTNVLWFMGGLIFTFWILYPIAKAAGRPDLVLRGGAIYAVIWLGITITFHVMLGKGAPPPAGGGAPFAFLSPEKEAV